MKYFRESTGGLELMTFGKDASQHLLRQPFTGANASILHDCATTHCRQGPRSYSGRPNYARNADCDNDLGGTRTSYGTLGCSAVLGGCGFPTADGKNTWI
eukprot:8268182-Pyramimonas_sp.AAC.1